jgi:hypothetical protein
VKASLWHQQATTPERALPRPMPAAELSNVSSTSRQLHASVVRAALRERTVRSSIHERAAEQMTRDLESAFLEPAGARTVLSLSAPYTAGKTTQVKRWSQALYRQWADVGLDSPLPTWKPRPTVDADLIPVCYLTLLSAARRKDLYSQILSFMGYPSDGVQRALADRTVLALANHRTRLVILDDAHMLKTSNQIGRETLDAIKHINSELGELGGVILLVGADITNSELLTDPQIEGRLAANTIAPYSAETDADRRTWQHLLRAIEDELAPYLAHHEPGAIVHGYGPYIFKRTQGFIGDTTRLLVDAAAAAIASDRPLDRDMLDQVRLSERATATYATIQDYQQQHRRKRRADGT